MMYLAQGMTPSTSGNPTGPPQGPAPHPASSGKPSLTMQADQRSVLRCSLFHWLPLNSWRRHDLLYKSVHSANPYLRMDWYPGTDLSCLLFIGSGSSSLFMSIGISFSEPARCPVTEKGETTDSLSTSVLVQLETNSCIDPVAWEVQPPNY